MARKHSRTSRTVPQTVEAVDPLTIPKTLIALVEALAPSDESSEAPSPDPRTRADALGRTAAAKAAMISGSLSLPPGPLGWLTAVPELLAIWKVQDQLVNDIAAAFGERPPVQREKMAYCLFKNLACQAAKDAVIRIGERALVWKASVSLARRIFWRCGVPVLGAAGAAAYAWFDTMQVARRATALFEERRLAQVRNEEGTGKRPRRKTAAGKPHGRVRRTVKQVKRESASTGAAPSVSRLPLS